MAGKLWNLSSKNQICDHDYFQIENQTCLFLDPEAAVVVGRCSGAGESDDHAAGGGDCGYGCCPGPQVAG